MRHIRLQPIATLLFVFCATMVHAQQSQPTAKLPRLVRFSGSFRPAVGTPAQTMESVTLSVYRDQTGGDPMWHEIQNVAVDAEGHYSLLMGATQTEGMPLDLFASDEPRWLGVQFNRAGEVEQPRTLLVSVPYALKSVDADTLGGKPASAYLLAAPALGTDAASVSGGTATATGTVTAVKPKATPANSGQPNYIGKFSNTTDLIDSSMYEVNGNVGIFTKTPAISLDVRTGALPQMGIAGVTDYLTFFASDQYGPAIYWDPAKDMRFGKGGTGLYNPYGFVEHMRIQSSTGNVGIGTMTPGSTLDVNGNFNFSGSVRYQGNPVLQVPGGAAGQNIAVGLGALQSNTSGSLNTAVGGRVLQNNTTGNNNTASGQGAMQNNISGCCNTASGQAALFSNTTGNSNTAIGGSALQNNTTGNNNTATGQAAMANNISGCCNTASGQAALFSNTTGNFNTAIGGSALQNNTTGTTNTASGQFALTSNTTGNGNTADGQAALQINTTGSGNTAVGFQAMMHNNAGGSTAVGSNAMQQSMDACCDAAFGQSALQNNTFGQLDTAIGGLALQNNTTGNSNTAVGQSALVNNTIGNNNIAIGQAAAQNVSVGNSNNIHIGSLGSSGDSGAIRVGDSANQTSFFAAGVRGITTHNNDAIPVMIDSAGQLGTVSSSRRFKEDIEDMGAASNDLMRLRPVTFRYKESFGNGSKPIQYGLIAEEVAEVYPDLVAHSADGKIETVKYQVLDSMLLNEVQRQQAEIRRLEERLLKLEAALASASGELRSPNTH